MGKVESLDLLRIARALGFDLSLAEIEEIRGEVEQGLASIERLDELQLSDIEPAPLYRLEP